MPLKPLLNRAEGAHFALPADGYYHVVPFGTFPHSSGIKQVVDQAAAESILDAFRDDQAKKLALNDDCVLLADYDHFSSEPDQSSEAAGWIQDMRIRDDGIYAKIRWTDQGEKAVVGGNYRYASPVWKPEEVQRIDAKTIRPLRLDRIGLTNDPNMKGMKALSNRASAYDPKEVKPFWNRASSEDAFVPPSQRSELPGLGNNLTLPAMSVANKGIGSLGVVSRRGAVGLRLPSQPQSFMGTRAERNRALFNRRPESIAFRNRAAFRGLICNSASAALSSKEQALMEKGDWWDRSKQFNKGDKDARPVPMYHLADGSIVNKIFMEAVKKYQALGMSYKAAWLKARENNPSAYAAYLHANTGIR